MTNPYQSPRSPSDDVRPEGSGGRSDRSAADKAYRRAALPFGLFMLVGGVACGLGAFAFPAQAIFLPPFEAEMTKRAVFFAIAILVLVMGAGFLTRRSWALYVFIAYVLLGTAWHVAIGLADPAARPLLASPLFNLPLGYVICRMTRPAFHSHSEQHGRSEA